MANTYTYTGPGTRWSEEDPTAEDYLNVSRINADHLHEALNIILDTAAATGLKTLVQPLTVGVNDAGHDVKFFGNAAGAYMEWDTSEDQLRIMGASADATTSTGKLLLATSLTDINANDVLGKIDFQAPHETGTDAIEIAASIQAVAQGTFAADLNATDLIFYTGHSEAATEKFRMTSQGEIGIGGANYGTDGQVLTSAGAGAAVVWDDAVGLDVSAILSITNATESTSISTGSINTDGGVGIAKDVFLAAASSINWPSSVVIDGGSTAGALSLDSDYDGGAGLIIINAHSTSPYGIYQVWSGASPNNTNYFYIATDATEQKFRVDSDGDVFSRTNSFGAFSDIKLKRDIVDARSYWDDFKALTYHKFKFKTDVAADGDAAPFRLGLVAQEVETVFPGCVVDQPEMDEAGSPRADGSTCKTVKSSIIEGAIMGRVVQVAQARIEALESRVAALE